MEQGEPREAEQDEADTDNPVVQALARGVTDQIARIALHYSTSFSVSLETSLGPLVM